MDGCGSKGRLVLLEGKDFPAGLGLRTAGCSLT